MSHVEIAAPDVTLDEPVLVEGLPGKGLVGKMVADYLRSEFDMTYYAGIYCEGVPSVAAYRMEETSARPPVQVFAAPKEDFMVLVSDIPVSSADAPEFADCVVDFLVEHAVTPIFTSGFDESVEETVDGPTEDLYGIATGGADALLDEAGVRPPRHAGIVTGPTGALINRAGEVDLDSVGLLVKSGEDLPDFAAALTVLERGIEPITGFDVDTEPFADGSIEMSPIAESVLESMQAGAHAEPTATFQ